MRGAAGANTQTLTTTKSTTPTRPLSMKMMPPVRSLVAASRLALSSSSSGSGSRKTMAMATTSVRSLSSNNSSGSSCEGAGRPNRRSIFIDGRPRPGFAAPSSTSSFSSSSALLPRRRGSLLPASAATALTAFSSRSSSSKAKKPAPPPLSASPSPSVFERFRRARWPTAAAAAASSASSGAASEASSAAAAAAAAEKAADDEEEDAQPAKLVVPPPPAPSADAPDWAGTTFASPAVGEGGRGAEAPSSSSAATDAPPAARRGGGAASPSNSSSSNVNSPASLSYSSLSSLDLDDDGILKPLPPASPLDVRRRVFCNRSLNMKSIRAVGFDMDYTLAQYRPETFEALAYRLTVDKLVSVFGYPALIKEFEFDWRYMARGLTIDKARGNILKIDRHKYVKLAFHGFSELSREERLATYARPSEAFDYDEPDFALIDTLFSLAEAHLFMQLVELAEAAPEALPPGKVLFRDLYRDVRAAVDLCHRDGSLKSAVAANPGEYVHEDKKLAPLLRTLRNSGRRVFLATNSLWDYTDVVMRYLLGGGVNPTTGSPLWLDLFDVVVTGCGKPAFFKEARPLLEVDPATGLLRNTDSGTPMVPIGEADLPARGAGGGKGSADSTKAPSSSSSSPASAAAASSSSSSSFASGASTSTTHPSVQLASRRGPARVFQGGTYLDLHRRLGISSGAEVLYVGDHIYGDILRSKKTLGWRTMLVVPELEAELDILSKQAGAGEAAEMRALRAARDALEDQIQRLEWALEHPGSSSGTATMTGDDDDGGGAPGDRGPAGAIIDSLKLQRDEVRARHRALLKKHHERFHAVWGRLLKAGYQNSRYAHQVQRFACLYSSHVSNLAFYSPEKSWRATPDAMAHEEDPQLLAGARAKRGRREGGVGMTDEGASSSEIA